MNAEQLHDAISLLPGDLIAEADKKRTAPRPVPRWQRYAAMAACFGLVLFTGLWCNRYLGLGGVKEAAREPEAPMEAWVEEAAPEVPVAEAAPKMEAAADEAPAEAEEDRSQFTGTGSSQSNGPMAHSEENSSTGCQASPPQVTVSGDFETRTLTPEERLALSRLLSELTYLPEEICECIAEITVTVNGEDRFSINLEEGFVRCGEGQARLDPEQIDTLRAIFYPEG